MADLLIVERLIVKIQIPLGGEPQVYVYDESRMFKALIPYDDKMKLMLAPIIGDRIKVYMYANVVNTKDGYMFDLLEEAPIQNW